MNALCAFMIMLKHVNNQGETVASINNAIEKMQERSALKIKFETIPSRQFTKMTYLAKKIQHFVLSKLNTGHVFRKVATE